MDAPGAFVPRLQRPGRVRLFAGFVSRAEANALHADGRPRRLACCTDGIPPDARNFVIADSKNQPKASLVEPDWWY